MSLVLIKETGAGLANANSYADAADGDNYFDGHLYATAWTGAITGDKEKALVFATRLIESQYQFGGIKTSGAQSLLWPRVGCPDADAEDGSVKSDLVPSGVRDAVCEMARELLKLDRTAAPPGEGVKYHSLAGEMTGYSKVDIRPIITPVAQAMLRKFGVLTKGKSGEIALART